MKALKRELLRIFVIVIPLSLALTFLILRKWHSSSVVDWPNLYGLFYPVTSDSVGYTFNYNYYLKGLIIHLMIFGLVGYLIVRFFDLKLKSKIFRRILIVIVWIGFLIFVFPRIVIVKDANFMWDYDKNTKFENRYSN